MPLADSARIPRAGDPPVTATTRVVCVGFSTGGLHPLKTIFERLNPDTGMTYVVIPHLSRTRPTYFPWLLAQWSRMPSDLVQHGMELEPNHIYTIPPGQEITLADGRFSVRPRSKVRGWSNVITLFLDSLMRFGEPPGIAVILSGYDADGAAALEAFRDRGGITIVQELKSAHVKDMPKSAIATGAVDYVLEPDTIAEKIESIAKSYADHAEKARSAGK